MIRRRSNPSSCRSGISVSCGLRKPTKSRAAKMPCAMCNSLLRGGEFGLTYFSFNPPAASRTGRTATPARNARASASIIRPTCKPPAAWLGPKFLAQAEYIKETQPTKYRHEYLGEVVGSGTQVFENLRLEPIAQKTIRNFDTIENGVDWGWYPDPWAFNRCHYDAARKTLYIFDELTRLRTSNEETAKLVQRRIESWGERDRRFRRDEILRRLPRFWHPCREAVKGPGSGEPEHEVAARADGRRHRPPPLPPHGRSGVQTRGRWAGRDDCCRRGLGSAQPHSRPPHAVNRIWMRRGA